MKLVLFMFSEKDKAKSPNNLKYNNKEHEAAQSSQWLALFHVSKKALRIRCGTHHPIFRK